MDENDNIAYRVVVNHEEQYSIWPVGRENAPGWKDAGKQGSKEECLDHINEVWTDMRPLSLRKKMEEMAKNPPQPEEVEDDGVEEKPLVERLSGQNPVEITIRPEATLPALKACLERAYVHVKFTETRGGTEIGVTLDRDACRFSEAELESGEGELHLEGDLTLDFTRVRCVADIDLKTFKGTGSLNPIEEAVSA